MSTLAGIEMGGGYDHAVAVPSHPVPSPRWIGAAHAWHRRHLIECMGAIAAGALIALGYAAFMPSDSNMSARRERLEREWASLSGPLAEYARLERAGQGAQASAAAAAARARPSVELRLLLETLSREARAGVTVRRLRQSREGVEMLVRAADSAACAAWVARLARVPGWEGAAMVDLRLVATPKGRPAGREVEANVRVPSPMTAAASESESERARTRVAPDGEEPDGRRGR